MSKPSSAAGAATTAVTPSGAVVPFKSSAIAVRLLPMLGYPDDVTFFHHDDEGNRAGVVQKPVAEIAAAIREADKKAGGRHVFASLRSTSGLCGYCFAFRKKEDAQALADSLSPSFVIKGANGSLRLVYLFEPAEGSEDLLRELQKHDNDDAYTDDSFPLPYEDFELDPADADAMREQEELALYTLAELDAAFFGGPDDDGSGLSAEPTEIGDEVEYFGEWNPDVRDMKVHVSKASSIQGKGAKNWRQWSPGANMPTTFGALAEKFGSFQVREKKDGEAFFPGELSAPQKIKPNVKSLTMVWVDVDNGAEFEDTKRAALGTPYAFILHASHNYGTRDISQPHSKYVTWCEKAKGGKASGYDPNKPTAEIVREFLRDTTVYLPHVIEAAEFDKIDLIDGGPHLLISTVPIPKHRIGFVLSGPVERMAYLGRERELALEWSEKQRGMGALVGVEIDESTTNLDRAYYFPSRKLDATPPKIVIRRDGRSVDWSEIGRVPKQSRKNADPFADAAEQLSGSESIVAPGGINLKHWAAEKGEDRGDYFDIASAFLDSPLRKEIVFKEQGSGHLTVRCPIGDHPPKNGDHDPGCYVKSMDANVQRMEFQCSHATCQPLGGKDRLRMLCEAIKLGWIDEESLRDPKYDLMGDRESSPQPIDLDDLIAKATEEKAAAGYASASTMDALMNAVARQPNRIPIFERIKALKLVAMTDFKKDVDKRAKDFAKAIENKEREKSPTHYKTMFEAIEAMNREIALVERGSDVVIYQKRENGDAWKRLEAARNIYLPWTAGKAFDAVFPAWMQSGARDHRTDIVFEPYRHGEADPTPSHHLNMYRGIAVQPVDAWDDCMDYLRHVFHIVCNGDKRLFAYVMSWCADMLQNPGTKSETALVLRGLKGTGKGLFAVPLRQIWGLRHSVKVNNLKQLTGNFNGHMDAKILAVAEESFWGGDKQSDSVIKDMITSDTMMMERKFMDAVELPDCRRFIFLSNADNVIRATPDERRYAVTVVPDDRKHHAAYFKSLGAQIKSGRVSSALAHLLLHLDIRVDLRDPPRTDALIGQILTNLPPEDNWLRSVLEGGTFLDAIGDSLLSDADRARWVNAPLTVSKDTVYVSYRSMVKAHTGKEVSTEHISKFLIDAFRENKGGESLVKIEGNGVVGRNFIFPSLLTLVELYETKFGVPLHHKSVENDADFIRVKEPKVIKIPKAPVGADAEAWQRYEGECRAYEEEREQVFAEADAFIADFFGRGEIDGARKS